MFTTIRGRLWISYAALVMVALLIVTAVVAVFLIRNPYVYRQTASRIAAAEKLLLTGPRTAERVELIAAALDVRVLVLSADGAVISDSDAKGVAMRLPPPNARPRDMQLGRDASGVWWLFTRAKMTEREWLIVAAPRPRVLPAINAAGDELWRPIAQGGAVALLLAVAMSYLLSGWISTPLQRLVEAARRVGGMARASQSAPRPQPGPAERVREAGPDEVRELTRAFNAMLDRVSASDKAQKEFVANVSHELKTPLTAIQGFAQALADGTADTAEKRAEAAEIIHRESGRLHRLAVDLLDLESLDAGTMQLRIAPVDVSVVAVEAGRRLQPLAQAAGVRLELPSQEGLPIVYGDADRLMQAVTNIIDNAIKFTPRGGRVQVLTQQVDAELCVSIKDTGEGIAPAELSRIFDRFYQADGARDRSQRHGSGLGLAIAREVIGAHGGKISVRSNPGQGAEFVVHLPLTQGGGEEREAA